MSWIWKSLNIEKFKLDFVQDCTQDNIWHRFWKQEKKKCDLVSYKNEKIS